MYWLIKFAMCAMMPRTQAFPGIGDTDLDGFLRRMRRDSDWLYWSGVVLGAVVFALAPIATVGWPLPAFLLPASVLERHAEAMLAHRIYVLRQAAYLVRLSAGMCWGADPAVRARLDLPPYGDDPGTFRTS